MVKKDKDEAREKEQNLIELGKFYFLNGKYDAAIGEFQKSLRINPKNVEIYYNLGLAYEGKNELHKAKEMYLKALELDEKFTLARVHLDKLVGT